MAWQPVQASPACDSGLSMISRSGRSMSPEYSGAGSWQPAHHFADCTPFTSCMYSIDLRYHWLLNDEKWCALSFHWAKTSLWQRPHFSDSRKKLASMFLPEAVRAEEGKNGPEIPSPSFSMPTGGHSGF